VSKVGLWSCGSIFFWTCTRQKLTFWIRIHSRQKIKFWARTRPVLDPSLFSLIFDSFSVQNQRKDQYFSYSLIILRKKINMKLFLVVSPYIVLFRFEAKSKPSLTSNLYMDPDPNLEGPTAPYWSSLMLAIFGTGKSEKLVRSLSF